jgi:pimeloyl-ACP methyl ester carboxylesterase
MCVAGITLTVQSCSMPGPKATSVQIAALSRATVTADETAAVLSYLHAGDPTKPRIIYIHGTPGSADGWADFLVNPVPGFEAVAVDRLGFGQSGARVGGVDSFEKQAAAIAPLLVERDGKWPILIGHSLGGPIASRLAVMHPDKVGGLIIVAGSLDPAEEKPGLAQSIGTTGFARFFMPQVIDNSMGELDAAEAQTKLLASELSKVTCPVVIIHGTVDELVPFANVAYMERMFTGASSVCTVRLEKQGHFIPWERPEAIRDAVERFGSSH